MSMYPKYGIMMVMGDVEETSHCGSETAHYARVSDKQAGYGSPEMMKEPIGSFNDAEAGIVFELNAAGKVVGVKIIHAPVQQWWDDCYDQHLLLARDGNVLKYVPFGTWIRVWENNSRPKELRATVWANVRKMGVRAANAAIGGGIDSAALAAIAAMEAESEKYPTVISVKLTSDDLHVD